MFGAREKAVDMVGKIKDLDFVEKMVFKNGKIVFEHLLDYYLNKNGLSQDQKLLTWWKK